MTEPGFIGQSVERKEDYRFLTGAGQYTDDITLAASKCRLLFAQPARARAPALDRHHGRKECAGCTRRVYRQGHGERRRAAVWLAN